MTRAIIEEIRRFTPTHGFNVVAVDAYALPGERLTLVSHYPTREGAERRVEELRRQQPTSQFEVYAPLDLGSLPGDDK